MTNITYIKIDGKVFICYNKAFPSIIFDYVLWYYVSPLDLITKFKRSNCNIFYVKKNRKYAHVQLENKHYLLNIKDYIRFIKLCSEKEDFFYWKQDGF